MPTPRPPVGGCEESPSERISFQETRDGIRLPSTTVLEEFIMANVRVEQRNAHLAGVVRLEWVNGREGKVAKGTLTAISNVRRGSGDDREEEATALLWTLWGKQAENAAEYLGKGSHVNIVGRVRNNNYRDAEGNDVYGLAFTCEEIDYLESRADAEARRARQEAAAPPPAAASRSRAAAPREGKARSAANA